jgi:hypothetical protein
MRESDESSLDGLLKGAFPLDPDRPVDGGFSVSVVRRIRRRQKLRGILLGTAAVVGVLVALVPAWDLIAAAGLNAESLVARWSAGSVPAVYDQAASAAALALLALLITRILET